MSEILERIDRLKRELDALRPLPPDAVARVGQKLRIESSYHSNAVEGNSLTLGETRSLILHGLTAHGKPMRDHLDIEGHNDAVKAVEDAVGEERGLTEAFIRQLHAVLLKEPYEADAEAPDGRTVRRRIGIGAYKTAPNNVRTSTRETYYFTPPERVKPAMGDLMDWYRTREAEGEHPVVLAAAFHYRFVRIHPFDDGNGRMARLLMNMILIGRGYTVAIVRREDRDRYIGELERADKTEDLAQFIDYIASCCEYALNLHLKAARGESIEDTDDIDREIALFRQSFVRGGAASGQVAARNYIERVVRPFRKYCRSKIALFSEEFASIDDSGWRMNGEGVDGDIFDLDLNVGENISDIPENAFLISNRLNFHLSGFHGMNSETGIAVENRFDPARCDWRFQVDNYLTGQYDGQDLDELKKQFNRLLRSMMKDFRQRTRWP